LTNVSATANVTSEYSHVWITINDVKFNTSASAAPGDSSWIDFPLSTPVTIDLATVTNGGLAVFGNSLKVPTGTYQQMQLLLADPSASLTSSATTAGLLYNDQVQYLNSAGAATTSPLDLVDPAQGVVLAVTLSVPSNLKAELEALDEGADTTADETEEGATTGVGTTGTTGTTTTGLGVGTTTTPVCTPTTTTGTTTTTATSTPITTTDDCTSTTNIQFTVGISFDTERDLVPFTYSGQPGFLLNPHLTGYDLSTAGTIQGQLNLCALTSPSSCTTTSTTTTSTTGTTTLSSSTASGNPAIEVSAEALSSDGTRHVVVLSAPVQSDGSFVLYPLATNATSAGATTTTTYDLVVHGPQIQTLIIQQVPPSVGAPSSATSASLNVTLASADDFLVNLSTTTHFTTAAALVQFYQTVPVSGEVPYVVAQQPIDPFNLDFAGDAALPVGPIAVTAYSGANAATPISEAPSEGSGVYRVAAIAPNFNDGPLTPTVTAPATITTTTPAALVSLAPLTVATGGTAETLTVETSVVSPGKYNGGELILSANGAIIAVTSLSAVLNESAGSVTFANVPGGTSDNLFSTNYNLSAWVWNSSNPSGTLSRQSSSTAISMSGGSTHASITID
jgi:hypothetical protein